ncbi:unnamed protein product [Calypogeia fissa]
MTITEVLSVARRSSEANRYVLCGAIVKGSTILSGWNAADLLPSASTREDTIVQEAEWAKQENYHKHPAACKKAVKWLTLITMWALQEGLSSALTKQIVEEHLEEFKHYLSINSATWDDFVHVFFARHKIEGATQFVKWYRHQRAFEFGRNTWFSYDELQRATSNFSRALKCADGNTSVVYKGIDQFSEQFIAVKRLKKVTDVSLRKVLYEVAVNSYIKKSFKTASGQPQAPLVTLLGFSPNKADPLIVFEFLPKGNLRQHLQGHYGKHLRSHPADRLRIAIDVASALRHLHFNCESPIFHRDVKATNILLDSRYRAKLADLSKAKIQGWSLERSIEIGTTLYSVANIFGCSENDSAAGSPGYVDPVFQRTRRWNESTDVYSFGVVLMELATHLKAWDPVRRLRLLTDFVREKVRVGHETDILTAKVGTPEGEALERLLFLGIDCCSFDPTIRPSIDEVETTLRLILGELRFPAWFFEGT